MKNAGIEVQTYTKPLKRYHNRYYKIISILKHFQKNVINYNQTTILNTLNFFLLKDKLMPITLRTLRKDLAFLCNNGIIKKTLLRLGEGNGSYIRYTVNKYSINNLKRLLKATEKIVEHDANAVYKFTKETQKKHYLKNKKVKIFKSKNVTKNVSHIIINNKYINNKEKKEIPRNENPNSINEMISNISKWKTMRYLNKIEENKNKRRYEDNMVKTKKWLEELKTNKIIEKIYNDHEMRFKE